jgi:probable O-glycosylation ligase (exosortase A-associated)
VYIAFALLKPDLLWWWSVPAWNYSRVIGIALLVGWAIHGFGNFDFGKAKWIVLVLVVFIAWEGLATAFAADSVRAWRYYEVHLKIALPFLVGVTSVKTERQVNQLAWTILLCMGFLAYQVNNYYFSGYNILARRGFIGIDNNSFAINLVAATGLAFFLGFETEKLIPKLIAFASAALMAHAILFSFSRGAMLALCVVGIVAFFLIPKRPLHLALFGFGVSVALVMAGAEVRERFSTVFAEEDERDASAESRVVLWKGAIAMMNDYPIFGVGPDNFRLNVDQYTPYEKGKAAHGTWFQVGAESGYLGFILFPSFYFLCAYKMNRLRRKLVMHDKYPGSYIPHLVIVSIAGFCVAATFVSCHLQELSFYIVLLGAVSLKCMKPERDSRHFSQIRLVYVPHAQHSSVV